MTTTVRGGGHRHDVYDAGRETRIMNSERSAGNWNGEVNHHSGSRYAKLLSAPRVDLHRHV